MQAAWARFLNREDAKTARDTIERHFEEVAAAEVDNAISVQRRQPFDAAQLLAYVEHSDRRLVPSRAAM